jgi:replicative DNA helicase
MLDTSAMDEVTTLLTSIMFYREAHQKIFEAAFQLYKANKFTDLYSVSESLRNQNELDAVGGPVYITELTSRVVSAANVRQHAMYVKQKYIQRELIRISTELQNRAFDDTYDIAELIEYAEKEIYGIGDTAVSKEPIMIGNLLNILADTISLREAQKTELAGVPSGLIGVDRITLGWQPGDLIILAARPSMGKSALAIQFGRFAAQLGHGVLMFSLEMTDTQLGERYLSAESGHDTYDLKRGRNIIWAKIEKAIHSNTKTPLWIDDSAHMTLFEFRSKVRRAKKKHNIQLVICDYLNLFTGDETKDNMSEKYGSISKMFKAVAKECKVAVLSLAQLNRGVEQRSNPLPKLSDLRNSGEIEQDADIIVFPTRYILAGMHEDSHGRNLDTMALIDVAKNRNGRVDQVEVNVSADCMIWTDQETATPVDFTQSKTNEEPPFA